MSMTRKEWGERRWKRGTDLYFEEGSLSQVAAELMGVEVCIERVTTLADLEIAERANITGRVVVRGEKREEGRDENS